MNDINIPGPFEEKIGNDPTFDASFVDVCKEKIVSLLKEDILEEIANV